MSVEERQQLLNEFMSGAITKETYLNLLDEGGVILDWEQELAALEIEGSELTGQTSGNIIDN